MDQIQKIEISHRTIIFTLVSLGLVWALYQLRGVILLVFISVILMAALNPGVDFLERLKVPRLISILLFYILVIAGVSAIIAGLVPPLIEQTSKLVSITPKLLANLQFLGFEPTTIMPQLTGIPSNALRFTISAVSNVIVVFTLLIFTFYLLLERKNLKHHLTIAFGPDGEKKAEVFVDQIELQLGRWVRGQL